MANRFWIGTTDDDYADTANWAATSGGAGPASVPIATDNAFFDAASAGNACTLDAARSINNINFTGYTGIFNGNTFLWTFTGDCTLENLATFTDVDLDFRGVGQNFTSDNSTIDNLILTNTTGASHVLVIASDPLNLNGTLTITTTSTAAMFIDCDTNNPDVSVLNVVAVKTSTGDPSLVMGSGTWTITGNTWDMTDMEITANTSTLVFPVTATFTWDDNSETFHNVTINFADTTNRDFNSNSGTTITLTGKIEINVTGTANLTIDFLTYVCPDGFITTKTSSGVLLLDGAAVITAITCRAGTGTNIVDMRGLTSITGTLTLNIGDADYTLIPLTLHKFTTVKFFSTLLAGPPRTITVSLNKFQIINTWSLEFTDDMTCDPLTIIFTNCEYVGDTTSHQDVNNKNAGTLLTLDMGNKDWAVEINSNGPSGHGTIFPFVDGTLTGTSGITTFTLSNTNVTDFDLTEFLNDVVILGGVASRTITFAAGKKQTVLKSLTLKSSAAGGFLMDYNTAQDFEVKGAFLMDDLATPVTLQMGTGNWKFGGDMTIDSGSIVLTAETSTVIFNGAAIQTVLLNGHQLFDVKNENTSLTTVIFNDAVDFQSYTSDASTVSRSVQFKNGVTHQINVITFTGAGAFFNFIRSTVLGSTFTLDTNAGQIVTFVDVRDSTASPDTINASGGTSVESGNVVGWLFGVGKPATQTIETSQVVTAVGKIIPVTVSHIAEFVSDPSVIKALTVTLSHTLEFTQVLSAAGSIYNATLSQITEFVQGPAFEPDLVCAPDSINDRDEVIFWFPFTTMASELVLPNPEIGDEHAIHTRVVVRHTRGGTRRAYNQGATFETFSFVFTGLNRTKRDQIIAFVKLSRSDTVRFLDHENRTWKGIITTSPVVLPSTGRTSPTDVDYSVALGFEGEQL